MNRREFLKELRRELEHLSFEERENAISYYEEYLDDAGPENEAEAIRGFGPPAAVAAGLKTEQAIIKAELAISEPPTSPKEGTKKVWLVILAIFSMPLGVLAIVAAVLIFALFIVIGSLILAFGVTAFALVAAGIVCAVGSFFLMFTHFPTFLFFLGGSAVLVGVGILFWFLTHIIATKLLGGFASLLGGFLKRRKRGTQHEA